MEENHNNLSTITKYMVMLEDATDMYRLNPCESNKIIYEKWFNLYCEEYKRLFGCTPDIHNLINNEKNEDNQR